MSTLTETVQPATAGTSTRYVPVAPGTEMLVNFATHAYKVMGLGGDAYISRQRTNIPAGETLICVADDGRDSNLTARWGKFVFQVYRGDLVFVPSGRQTVHALVEEARMERVVEEAKGYLAEIERLKADIKEYAAEVMRREEERDVAQEEATKQRERADRWEKAYGRLEAKQANARLKLQALTAALA